MGHLYLWAHMQKSLKMFLKKVKLNQAIKEKTGRFNYINYRLLYSLRYNK